MAKTKNGRKVSAIRAAAESACASLEMLDTIAEGVRKAKSAKERAAWLEMFYKYLPAAERAAGCRLTYVGVNA